MMEWKTPKERQAWSRRLLCLRNEESFNACALELYAWQINQNRAYRDYLRRRETFSNTILSWRELPAVPQELFKSRRLASHPRSETRHTFLSSGTTGTQRSQHHWRDLVIYRSVSTHQVPLFDPQIMVAGQTRMPLHFLTPPPKDAPQSSLSTMFGFWKKAFGSRESRFWIHREHFSWPALRTALEKSVLLNQPVGLLGPAFSFVPLLESWSQTPLSLPAGSFVMETGGFKGRTREIRKPTFYRQLQHLLGVTEDAIWNEYGMCELGSQAYAQGIKGTHQTPPWARVLVIDPATNQEVRVGQQGLVRWIDLANTDSVLAVQTQDLARRTKEGFFLLGRLPQLPLRGCSLSVEDLQ